MIISARNVPLNSYAIIQKKKNGRNKRKNRCKIIKLKKKKGNLFKLKRNLIKHSLSILSTRSVNIFVGKSRDQKKGKNFNLFIKL